MTCSYRHSPLQIYLYSNPTPSPMGRWGGMLGGLLMGGLIGSLLFGGGHAYGGPGLFDMLLIGFSFQFGVKWKVMSFLF